MGKKKSKKPRSSNIGRRTGVNVLEGKLIRRRDDGIDRFEDYWTDSDSVRSDQTTLTNNSIKNRSEGIPANVSIQDNGAVSPMKPLRSSLKKTVNESSGEYDDYGGDSSPGKKKSLSFSEDVENATITRTKMTQTSHLLDETESSPSKNRMYLKEIRMNKDGLSVSEKNSSGRNSPRILSNTFAQNRMGDLPLLTADTNAASVTLSHEMESGRKSLNKRNSRVDGAESSPSKNRTYTQISYLKEIGLKKVDSPRSETNSPVRRSPRVLSNTFTQNRTEDFPLSTNAANVSLSHEMESGKKTKNKTNFRVDEAEGTPSKNRTYTQISYMKEIGLKKVDSPRSEANSPVRRSPRVLSNSSSLLNSRKKDNKRNSSEERSPKHTTKSPEVLNYEENILSRNNRSPIRSEISVSHHRESEKKGNMRKSSEGKSPIAVKRKKQVPNALEGNMSKTPRTQNIVDEGNRMNSPGGRSTRSSEVLNQEESIPSRRDKRVSRPEIVVSAEKQRSSTEKSPRASEHNMMQISNSTDSHKKTVKPVHSARRKIVFSETRKDVLQEKEPSPQRVRRSSRKRFPCLASWRNERPKFVKSNSGEITCVGIDKGQPEDDFAYRVLKKKLYGRKKNQKPKASNRKRKNVIAKTAISDFKSGRTVELNLHRPFSTCEWTKPMNDESAGYMITKVFSSQLLSFGFLDIDAHSMKDEQFSPRDNVYFVVVKGVVDAVIASTSFTFRRGDSFIVPIGTGYSLSNNTSSSALLNYCAFKISFFNYQEND